MAVCEWCMRDMSTDLACTEPAYEINGETLARIPNGEDICHDCRTPPGALHHPGCDTERCPACKGQAISCGCGADEDLVTPLSCSVCAPVHEKGGQCGHWCHAAEAEDW